MENTSEKALLFDGTNYSYWKIRMSTYLRSIGCRVWDICSDQDSIVLAARVGEEQIDQHGANSKARNALFACLSLPEFERVSNDPPRQAAWEPLPLPLGPFPPTFFLEVSA